MLWTRYAFAARFCSHRDVLEVACGPGQGLAHLGEVARRVVGGDYTERLLRYARAEYHGTVPLVQLDAQQLPFAAGSFDVVVLFEALYYLHNPGAFVGECVRILRPGGRIVICSANPAHPDFNPSPYSHRYLDASDLQSLFGTHGLQSDLFGAFDAPPASLRDHVVAAVKRIAVVLGLVPKTMAGKQLLKRIFLGRLTPVPGRISAGAATYREPRHIRAAEAAAFKVLYAVATRT
jgi:SAM-dependent methyltransferase